MSLLFSHNFIFKCNFISSRAATSYLSPLSGLVEVSAVWFFFVHNCNFKCNFIPSRIPWPERLTCLPLRSGRSGSRLALLLLRGGRLQDRKLRQRRLPPGRAGRGVLPRRAAAARACWGPRPRRLAARRPHGAFPAPARGSPAHRGQAGDRGRGYQGDFSARE